MKTRSGPIEAPVMHVDTIEPSAKRQKTEHPPEDTPNVDPWQDILEQIRKDLPKSGVKTWTNPSSAFFQQVQEALPTMRVGAIRAGKGLERYIPGDVGWTDDLPIRYTVSLKRFSHEIVHLGEETDWTTLTKAAQHGKAIPSHVLVCVFATRSPMRERINEPIPESQDVEMSDPTDPQEPAAEASARVDVPAWTPMAAAVHGPKFLILNEHDRGIIKKLHNNLGHPTAEKLSKHLAETRAPQALIEGAKDYLCASCTERRPPALTTPGNLKDASEFNEKIHLDGFDWESKNGIKAYVLHILDDATRFHLGQRVIRDTNRAIMVPVGRRSEESGS
eukprot:s1190_g33.t1